MKLRLALVFLGLATQVAAQPYTAPPGVPYARKANDTDFLAIAQALQRLDAHAVDVQAYGATGNGTTDDTTAVQVAVDSALHVLLPPGTYPLCNVRLRSGQDFECQTGAVITPASGCGGANPILNGAVAPAVTTGARVHGCKITTDGLRTGSLIGANGDTMRGFVFEENEVDLSAGGGDILFVASARDLTVQRNLIYGDCDYSDSANLFTSNRGGSNIVFRENVIECMANGVTLDSHDFLGAGDRVTLEGNYFDQFWMYARHQITNAGATGSTTYADGGVITDTLKSFPAIAARTIVRVLPVRATGTTVAQPSGSGGSRFEDPSANFPTAGSGAGFPLTGVRRGDIIRTATSFATVLYDAHDASVCVGSLNPSSCCTGAGAGATCPNVLYIEGWRDLTTFRPVAAPVSGTSYTVYSLVLGDLTSNTATTLTCTTSFSQGFHDRYGNDVNSIPAGTLYEVVARPNYHFLAEAGYRSITIRNNRFRRGWSDQIGCNGCVGALIEGNTVEEGSDGGITITDQGGGNRVQGNSIRDVGAAGIFIQGVENHITDNTIVSNRWINSAATTTLGGCVEANSGAQTIRNRIVGNRCSRESALFVLDTVGVALNGTAGSVGNVIEENTFTGHATFEVNLPDADVTGVRFYDNTGLTGGVVNIVPTGAVSSDMPITDTPATCAAGLTGTQYWDKSLWEMCVCNTTPAWAQLDGGGAGTSTSCG